VPAAGDQDLVAGGGAFHPVAEVVAEQMGADGDLVAEFGRLMSGASGARTRDLVHAMHALSQLSYGPSKGVICRKVYRRSLAVLRRREAELERCHANDQLEWDQIIESGCMVVRRDCIYLFRSILVPNVAVW
jgi:hypothetical protein